MKGNWKRESYRLPDLKGGNFRMDGRPPAPGKKRLAIAQYLEEPRKTFEKPTFRY